MSTVRRILFLLAIAGIGVGSSQAALPVELIDPASGASVKIESGARALHVVFFATWCPPCVEELDALAELEARWSDRGYRVLLVAVAGRQTRSKLIEFSKGRRLPGRLLFDADSAAERALGSDGVPTHLVFDSTGRELLRSSSLDSKLEQELERMLSQGRPSRKP